MFHVGATVWWSVRMLVYLCEDAFFGGFLLYVWWYLCLCNVHLSTPVVMCWHWCCLVQVLVCLLVLLCVDVAVCWYCCVLVLPHVVVIVCSGHGVLVSLCWCCSVWCVVVIVCWYRCVRVLLCAGIAVCWSGVTVCWCCCVLVWLCAGLVSQCAGVAVCQCHSNTSTELY